MREEPPKPLVDLMERLRLATVEQVRGVLGRVRRLARDLPLFESVWVDALAQARILTPFQAAEINAGRGERLCVGPYVVTQSLASPPWARWYSAREVATGRPARLAVVPSVSPAQGLAGLLERLVSASELLVAESLAPILAAGIDGDRVWAACRQLVGPTAGEWIVHNGRFAPGIVWEIARQIAAGLAALEKHGLCHGDLGAASVVLLRDGGVAIPFAGLRGLLRPEEGYAHADLTPEAYDYLSPERIVRGTPPDIRSDLYACGCLCWHLLTGRPPLPGGDSLAKLRAVETAVIADVAQLAPGTPAPLANAISACLQHDPSSRPEGGAQLARMLGPPTAHGRVVLAKCVVRPGSWSAGLAVSMRAVRRSNQGPLWLAALGGCLVAAAALAWSVWQAGLPGLTPRTPTERRESGSPTAHQRGGPSERRVAVARDRQADGGEPRPVASSADSSPGTAGRATPSIAPGAGDAPSDGSPGETANRLILPRGKPVAAGSLALRAGLRVVGEQGSRAAVVVPDGGLVIRPENVRFENVDFLGEAIGKPGRPDVGPSAIVELQASRAEFRGCSFQSSATTATEPVAVRWTHPIERQQAELALPSGRVRFGDCVFRNVGVALECRTLGAVAVEVSNSLHLGTGALVRLDHGPRSDEPTAIGLSGITLRGPGPLLECRYQAVDGQPGSIAIQSDGCAFVMPGQAALLSFVGVESPDRLLRSIQWNGQGSLVLPETSIAQWADASGRIVKLDDAAVSIAGLVRSEATFAGAAEDGPAASRLVRWQVPLQSANAPGIDPRSLSWPPR